MGFLPVTFGLGWWQAASAVVVGSALGSALLAPTRGHRTRTGTNNPVSSGAFFGVGGRADRNDPRGRRIADIRRTEHLTGGAALVGALDRAYRRAQ